MLVFHLGSGQMIQNNKKDKLLEITCQRTDWGSKLLLN